MILITQSGHYFARVMTAWLSWHVQNWDMIWSLFCDLKQNECLQDLDDEPIDSLYNGPQGPVNSGFGGWPRDPQWLGYIYYLIYKFITFTAMKVNWMNYIPKQSRLLDDK